MRTLEQSLWQDATRFDQQFMERVLAPNFKEFGRSGRTYSRQDCLEVKAQEIRAKMPLEGLAVEEISPDVVLITYVSETGKNKERANRSSLWAKTKGEWHLCFGQARPIN